MRPTRFRLSQKFNGMAITVKPNMFESEDTITMHQLHTELKEVKAEIQAFKAEFRRENQAVKAEVSHLRGATLPLASAVTLKASLNTFSLACLLRSTTSQPQTYAKIIKYLLQLRWIKQPAPLLKSKPSLVYVLPTDDFDILAHASFLLSVSTPQSLGTVNSSPPFLQLVTEINALFPAGDSQRLIDIFLTTRVGGQVRLGRNLAAHEVSVAAFIDTALAQRDAEVAGWLPPHPDWAEVLWLWKILRGGNADLDKTALTPYQLGITLYNSTDDDD